VQDFVGWMNRKAEADEKNLLAITQTIALMNLLESREQETDAVTLSTLHAAKGLEFGHVFLVGVEETILPHERSEAPEQIEEERRLMYVGITRAERSLQISYCTKRRRGKEWSGCEPSRFIGELPQDDLVFAGVARAGSAPAVTKEEGMDKLARLKAMLGQA
jgi:ATP-dependent DNA helicase Rep